ncbi:hypothetical protein BY996DRAFT_6618105 [Phakopsora pachyrhizi]|nr:hypothetical protein BY996DRAFT_6618105 [Phakopsora pachyrhizi]
MRERLKKKGREGKVEAFVKGLNSGSFDVVNYDYLTVSHKFTGGKLQDKVENKTINGGKTDGLQIWSWRVKVCYDSKEFKINSRIVFTKEKLFKIAIAPELNGGDTQVEELSIRC